MPEQMEGKKMDEIINRMLNMIKTTKDPPQLVNLTNALKNLYIAQSIKANMDEFRKRLEAIEK